MQRIILAFAIVLLSLVQIACQSSDKSSILIIAADNLAVSDISCNHENTAGSRSGFQLLCNESVRFTHAFTTSTLSAPALSSIMTGLYPFQHNVRHNGGPGLAPELELASEVAVHHDYRTSFFTGGPPIFRRSGLNQGFELFDDNLIPGFSNLFRPFKKNGTSFMQWLRHDVGNGPFFSVIYAPDLQFTNTITTTDLGETRNLSFESQVDELDESLFELFTQMKTARRWDNTTVILVGLSGHGNGDHRDLENLNLHSENTQVALFIKPAQKKKGDEPIYWKIDQNVNLADLGKTLFELLGESVVENDNNDFPTHSLAGTLKSPTADWPEDRPFIIESGWSMWRNAGPLRTAAISHHVLYINDDKPKLYNTLVDRMEVNPLPLLQQSLLETTNRLQALLKKNQFPAFTLPNEEWQAKLSIPYDRWVRPDQEPQLLRDLKRMSINNAYHSIDLLNWTAQVALNQKDWETLRTLGTKNGVALWQYVAERNLNVKNAKTADTCIALLTSKELDAVHMKECNDSLFIDLVDWLRADVRGLSKETQRKKFERAFKNYMLDQEIQRGNIAMGFLWDTSRESVYAPSRAELALHLPEYTKLRTQVYKSLATIDQEE